MQGWQLLAIEVMVGFAVPVGWGVRELWLLRKDRKRREAASAQPKR